MAKAKVQREKVCVCVCVRGVCVCVQRDKAYKERVPHKNSAQCLVYRERIERRFHVQRTGKGRLPQECASAQSAVVRVERRTFIASCHVSCFSPQSFSLEVNQGVSKPN